MQAGCPRDKEDKPPPRRPLMGSVISVYLGDFLFGDPEEIWKWLQNAYLPDANLDDNRFKDVPKMVFQREDFEYALELDLGVIMQRPTGGKLVYRHLIFAPGRVVAEGMEEISEKEARDSVLGAYLQLREAAGLARRMLEHRRIRKDPLDSGRDWTAWEHGLINIFPPSRSEQRLLERRSLDVGDLLEVGARLIAHNERIARKTVFRIPEVVRSFPPSPREVGIAWSAGVPLQGPNPHTQLVEWLDVPAEEIVRAHINASRERGILELLLVLDVIDVAGVMGKGPRALRFENGHIFFIDPNLGKATTEIEEDYAVQLVAENKLELRRAAVYAAWVEITTKQNGISEQELIQLDALATYGYAKKEDVPPAAHRAIEVQRAKLSMLHWAGLRVLEACQRAT
jgi:hypothetical protein